MAIRKSAVTRTPKRSQNRPLSSEEDFVRACLTIANDIKPGDTHAAPAVSIALMKVRISGSTEQVQSTYDVLFGPDPYWDRLGGKPTPSALPDGALALHDLLSRELHAVVGNVAVARRFRRARTDSRLDDMFVQTALTLRDDGRVEHRHMYIAKSNDGIAGLLTAFILDPSQRFGRDLRVCALPGCGRYFLADAKPGGGPRPRYCCVDHSKAADRAKATERAKSYRIRLAVKHK